jgi:hypothetical protein
VTGSVLVILATYMYMRIALPMNDARGEIDLTPDSSRGTIFFRSMKSGFACISILLISFASLRTMFSASAMLFTFDVITNITNYGNLTHADALQVRSMTNGLTVTPHATTALFVSESQPAKAQLFNKDDIVRANWGQRVSTNVSVAICIAGSWRSEFRISLPFVTKNLIESLNADVFAVSDGDQSQIGVGRTDRGPPEYLSAAHFQALFGARLKDAEHIPAKCMRNVCPISFPEICDTQKSGLKVFPYHFKIWRCGQLIHKTVRARGADYDVVLFMRPDMLPRAPFHLQAVPSDPGVFKLSVADSCVEFSQREIVISTGVLQCASDDMWLGSYAAMTVFMDMARFCTPHSALLSPEPSWDDSFKSTGGEVYVNWLAWRTGIHLLHFQTQSGFLAALLGPLSVDERLSCLMNAAGCSVFTPDKNQLLKLEGNKCQRLGVEPMRINHPWDENSCHDRVSGRSLEWHAGRGEISRARPECKNVTNLAIHNPLGKCRRRDDNSMSWQPGAHRVFVERGFGMPMILDNSSGC